MTNTTLPPLSPKDVSRLYRGRPSARVVLDMIHAGELQARRVRRRYYLDYAAVAAVLGESDELRFAAAGVPEAGDAPPAGARDSAIVSRTRSAVA